MLSGFRKLYRILIEAGDQFAEEHVTKLSASLAYYTIFSIGPLLLVILTILGFFLRKATITNEVFDQIRGIIGVSATKQLQSIIAGMAAQNHTTIIGIVSVLVFIFGATGIFSEIQSSINFIWSVRSRHPRGWWKYIRDRLLSLALVIGMGGLMMVSVAANFVIDFVAGRMSHIVGKNVSWLKFGNFFLLFLIVTFVFFIIFKVLPDAKIHWRDALIGAVFTCVLFLIGKFLIGLYLTYSKSLSLYGAATSIIVLLSWVYYSAMILYYGAEFTEVYAKEHGRGIKVGKHAVHIVKHETDILHPEIHTPHTKGRNKS